MTKLLFVASEAYPLVKTGGLADVAGSLPEALRRRGVDVRLLLPAYASILDGLGEGTVACARLQVAGQAVDILECVLPGTGVTTWLVGHPLFAARGGNPYHDARGEPWPDNAERFLLLSRTACAICAGDPALGWRPDVLHCNDWHTGPAIALARELPLPPRTLFTVHSLAHMGLFDHATFRRLGLPAALWQAMEFYGQCSFIKGGLVFADYITTVSPTYAREICAAPGGMGLEGLLSARRERLAGILNGIDLDTWDPAGDPHLAHNYDRHTLDQKGHNRSALQRELGLAEGADRPLLGFVGRLAQQKGLELMLPVLEALLDSPAQLVLLGTGERHYEEALARLAAARPGEMAAVLAHDEALAHRVEAGADIFLMPSLFEPCGLNQMYSLRYGTPPVVRAVGGLADTVVDADRQHLAAGTATGFVFREPDPGAFLEAVRRAIGCWRDRAGWRRIQLAAMSQDFSWARSADRYLELYHSASPQ